MRTLLILSALYVGAALSAPYDALAGDYAEFSAEDIQCIESRCAKDLAKLSSLPSEESQKVSPEPNCLQKCVLGLHDLSSEEAAKRLEEIKSEQK